jgi:hypothetical protein
VLAKRKEKMTPLMAETIVSSRVLKPDELRGWTDAELIRTCKLVRARVQELRAEMRQPAQAQIYNDAPYAWLGVMKLWDVGGSVVWDKSLINNFYMDPTFSGANTIPVFNTVTFSS